MYIILPLPICTYITSWTCFSVKLSIPAAVYTAVALRRKVNMSPPRWKHAIFTKKIVEQIIGKISTTKLSAIFVMVNL